MTPGSPALPHSRQSWRAADWVSALRYLAAVISISWLAWLAMHDLKVPLSVANTLAVLGPALAVLVVAGPESIRKLIDEAVDTLSWSRVLELIGSAYVMVPILLGAGVVVAVGVLHQRLTTGPSVAAVVEAMTVGMVLAMVGAGSEESGWRGHLFTALKPLGNERAAVLIGVAWGLWHAPAIMLYGYDFGGHRFAGIVMMTAFTVPFSVILCWVRVRGGSILPAIFVHAGLNSQVGLVAIGLTTTDSLLAAPVGLAGILPIAAFAGWLLLSGRLNENPSTSTASQPALEPEIAWEQAA